MSVLLAELIKTKNIEVIMFNGKKCIITHFSEGKLQTIIF